MSEYLIMKSKVSSDHWQCVFFLLLIVLLALTVLAQTNPGTHIPDRDYGFYLYIGERITRGDLLYKDVWDSKPPAIYFLNAAALWIGRGSRWGVWIVEYVFLFGAICFSFHLIRKLWGIWPALFGVIVWLFGLDLTLQGGNFTEEYPLLFHFIALIVFMKLIGEPNNRLNNFIMGLMFSLAFLFRPNNAVIEVVLISMLALSQGIRRNFRMLYTHILWTGLGVASPIFITMMYFHSLGLLQSLLEATILHALAYSNTQLTASSPLATGFQFLGATAWIALIGYLIALFQIRKSFGSPSFFLLVFLLAGWPITIFLSDPARRNYGHYFMNWLPFIALLSGFALHTLQNRFRYIVNTLQKSSSYAFLVVLVFASGYFIMSGRAGQYQKTMERAIRGSNIEKRSRYAIYVENHTQPGEYVLFWAALPGENFMANRDTPSSTLFYPLLVESDITKTLNDDFLVDFTENAPVLIVDMGLRDPLSLDPQKRREQRALGLGWSSLPDNLEQVFSFIEKNYYLEAEINGRSIYRLRGTRSP